MRITTHEELVTILDSGEFDKLIGLAEDQILEVKGPAPYDLKMAGGRFELAKDVSAFANADGGHLLIGLETQKLVDQATDEVKTLKLIPKSDLEVGKIEGIVRSHVWPKIDGLRVEWISSKVDPSKGLGIIHVPRQKEEDKLFIITKISIEGEAQKEIIVGIARRVGGDNLPLTAQQVYEAIRQGRDTVLQRSARIEEKLDALLNRPASAATTSLDSESLMRERIDAIMNS